MMTREHAVTLAWLMIATGISAIAIDFMRVPAWYAYEAAWLWWASGPSHLFLRPW